MPTSHKGFTLTTESSFITFCNLDKEDGSGIWSGFARNIEEAIELIEEIIENNQ